MGCSGCTNKDCNYCYPQINAVRDGNGCYVDDGQSFFMVWGGGQEGAKAVHLTYTSAVNESKRLANIYPNRSFFVLKAIEYSRKTDLITVKLK